MIAKTAAFLLLLVLPAFAADDTHLSSLPSDPLTATEAKRLYSIGTNARAVPVWLLLDGTGLGADAVARLEAATTDAALPASHTQLVHLVHALRDNSANGGWKRAVDGSPRWVIHVAVEETLFAKLKGHARVGTQKSRLKIAGPWSSFRTKTYCPGVFGAAACGTGKPAPFVLAGVAP